MEKLSWKTKTWHQWKSLRNVPFRRKWFVGYDLEGNSYWEFRDKNNFTRLRRIVEYVSPHMHYADYKGPPQWIQWLRQTRPNPPSIAELVADKARQARIKVLAAAAEQKWKQMPLKGEEQQSALRADYQKTADPRQPADFSPKDRMTEMARHAEEKVKEQMKPKPKNTETATANDSKNASSKPAEPTGQEPKEKPTERWKKEKSPFQPAPKGDDRTSATFKPSERG